MLTRIKDLVRQAWFCGGLIVNGLNRKELPIVIWTTDEPDEVSVEEALATGLIKDYDTKGSGIADYMWQHVWLYPAKCPCCGYAMHAQPVPKDHLFSRNVVDA